MLDGLHQAAFASLPHHLAVAIGVDAVDKLLRQYLDLGNEGSRCRRIGGHCDPARQFDDLAGPANDVAGTGRDMTACALTLSEAPSLPAEILYARSRPQRHA